MKDVVFESWFAEKKFLKFNRRVQKLNKQKIFQEVLTNDVLVLQVWK